MTHGQAFDSLDFLLDKSQAPWFDGFEKEYLLYGALLEWVKWNYKEFEATEKRRQDIDLILTRKKQFGPGRIINLNTVNEFFLILSLSGKWNFICKSKITPREIAIEPATHDELKTIKNDPHNCPADAFPRYEQYHNGTNSVLEIHSDNAPLSVELVYMKEPKKILQTTPTTTCELPDWAMHEVLEHARRKALGITEDFQSYQAVNQVEIPSTR